MQTSVRKGSKEDIPHLLRLIRELAAYEKAPAEVSVTEAELLNDGFGPSPVFNFFVAEIDNRIVGIALYYIKYSTWKGKCIFLEDIIVDEKFRGKGLGKLLFTEVAKVAKELNVKRLEWQVLDWNEPAIGFYKRLDANFDHEWVNCKLVYDQLQNNY